MKSKNGVIFTVLSLVMIFIMLFLFGKNRITEISDQTLSSYDKILLVDLNIDYPKTPEDVVALNNEIRKCLYGGMPEGSTEGDILKLVEIQRVLYDEELLNYDDKNTLENQYNSTLEEINKFKEDNIKFIGTTINATIYDDEQPRRCSVKVSQYTNNKETTMMAFNLKKNNDDKWKIVGWMPLKNENNL